MGDAMAVTGTLKVVCKEPVHGDGGKPLAVLVKLDDGKNWTVEGPNWTVETMGTWDNPNLDEEVPSVQYVFPSDEDPEYYSKQLQVADMEQAVKDGYASLGAQTGRPRLSVRCPDCKGAHVELRLDGDGKQEALLTRMLAGNLTTVSLSFLEEAVHRLDEAIRKGLT